MMAKKIDVEPAFSFSSDLATERIEIETFRAVQVVDWNRKMKQRGHGIRLSDNWLFTERFREPSWHYNLVAIEIRDGNERRSQ